MARVDAASAIHPPVSMMVLVLWVVVSPNIHGSKPCLDMHLNSPEIQVQHVALHEMQMQ
jgi:hypothetical protein